MWLKVFSQLQNNFNNKTSTNYRIISEITQNGRKSAANYLTGSDWLRMKIKKS